MAPGAHFPFNSGCHVLGTCYVVIATLAGAPFVDVQRTIPDSIYGRKYWVPFHLYKEWGLSFQVFNSPSLDNIILFVVAGQFLVGGKSFLLGWQFCLQQSAWDIGRVTDLVGIENYQSRSNL